MMKSTHHRPLSVKWLNAVSTVLLLFALCPPLLTGQAEKWVPIIPGAVGFGIHTPAGRGGQILRVTTLAPEGDGSLRAALETKGPRVIVFEVGGIIDLDGKDLSITEPFITVAGQTAPAPGITLIRGGLMVRTHDVLLQHLAVRPGDAGKTPGSGWEPDGISIGTWDGSTCKNVVVDHCSISWAIDENLSVSGKDPYPSDVTISNCIIALGLSHATHSKGVHSMGTLIHDRITRVALIGNLYAHNFRRNPYVKRDASVVICNNVIYNPGELGLHLSHFSGNPPQVSVVGNVFMQGPNTPDALSLFSTLGDAFIVYRHDNLAFDRNGDTMDIMTRGGVGEVAKWNAKRIKEQAEPPLWCDGLALPQAEPLPGVRTLMPAAAVKDHVLAKAGMRPGDRNEVDRHIIMTVRQHAGRIIDSQEEMGGYPNTNPTRHSLDLPDNPHEDTNGNGYTNLDAWLHDLSAKVSQLPGT